MSEKALKFWREIAGHISSRLVYSQIVIGASSGWITGLVTMNVGKFAACIIGGGIILLEIAHYEGYMKIYWSKVYKKLNKLTNKVEAAVTGEEKNWKDKAECFVDNKLSGAENLLKAKTKNVNRWYNGILGDDTGLKISGLHIFTTAFIGGLILGIAKV